MNPKETTKLLGPVARYIRARPVISVLFAVLATCGLATVLFPETADLTGSLGVFLGYSATGIVALRGVRRLEGRERLGWSGIGVAMLIAAFGVIVVAAFTLTGSEVSAFGPLDTFFLLAYAIAAVSIMSLPNADGRWSVRVRALVDGLVGAVAIATMAWVWFLSGYLDLLAAAAPGQRVVAMAYPTLDVVLLISLLMLSIRRSTYFFDRRLLLLSAALVFQTGADLVFAATGVGELFQEARPNYLLFVAGGVFFLASASIVHKRPATREFADRPARRLALIAPYGAATIMVTSLIWYVLRTDGTHVPLLAFATVTVFVLTFVRQAVSIRENRYQVDEDRRNLVSSISHELRTPLTSMFGMLELIRAGEIDLSGDEQKEFLEVATNQARHMSRIVSDLILLARDGEESIFVARSPQELDRLVRDAVGHVEGSELVEVTVPALTVTVDKDRFEQAIANLVGNAVKYGGGRVLVTAVLGDNLVIEVHDDGPAVPTRYELAIWNRFERGPRTLDSRVPGSGIGLAVVAKVAEAHGGIAGYRRSEVLGGACFSLSIPLPSSVAKIARIGADFAPVVIAL